MKKRPCPKYPQKDPLMVLADLRKRQEKMRVSYYQVIKSKIAQGREMAIQKSIGAANYPELFERLFFPKPDPFPEILDRLARVKLWP